MQWSNWYTINTNLKQGYDAKVKLRPLVSRPKPGTQICDHDRHANIKPKPDINKNQLNF